MKLKTMNKLIVVSSLLTISPTISKAEAVYMCEPCPAGYSCNKGVKTPCPAGTFAQAGARECSKCPEGKYQNATRTGCVAKCTAQKSSKMYKTNARNGCNEDLYSENGTKAYIPAGTIVKVIDIYSCNGFGVSNDGCGGGFCFKKGNIKLQYNSSTGKMDIYSGSVVVESIPAKDC